MLVEKRDLFIFWNVFLLLLILVTIFKIPSEASPITGYLVLGGSGDCGTVVNESSVLTSDITGCTAGFAALHINASNIVLDCQGYTIEGTVTAGIDNTDIFFAASGSRGGKNVTIKNCIVKNFLYGIVSLNDSVVIQNNTLTNLSNGSILGVGYNVRIINNIINLASSNVGISIGGLNITSPYPASVFGGNTSVIGNIIYDLSGVAIQASPYQNYNTSNNRIENNTIYNINNKGIRLSASGISINTYNIIRGNNISNTTDAGIHLGLGSLRNNITDNLLDMNAGVSGINFTSSADNNSIWNNIFLGTVAVSDSGLNNSFCVDTGVDEGNFYRGGVSIVSGDCGAANVTRPLPGGSYKDDLVINWTRQSTAAGYTVTYDVFSFGGGNLTLLGSTTDLNFTWSISSNVNGSYLVGILPWITTDSRVNASADGNLITVLLNNNEICSDSAQCEFTNITACLDDINDSIGVCEIIDPGFYSIAANQYYVLSGDDSIAVIKILSDNVEFDMNGSTFEYKQDSISGAILIEGNNITIRNGIFKNITNNHAIYSNQSSNAVIENNTFTNVGNSSAGYIASFSPLSVGGVDFDDCVVFVWAAGTSFAVVSEDNDAVSGANGTNKWDVFAIRDNETDPFLSCGVGANATVYVDDTYPVDCPTAAALTNMTCLGYANGVFIPNGAGSDYTFNTTIFTLGVSITSGYTTPPFLAYATDVRTQDKFPIYIKSSSSSHNITLNTFNTTNMGGVFVQSGSTNNKIWLNNIYYGAIKDENPSQNDYCVDGEGNFFGQDAYLGYLDGADCGNSSITLSSPTTPNNGYNGTMTVSWRRQISFSNVSYELFVDGTQLVPPGSVTQSSYFDSERGKTDTRYSYTFNTPTVSDGTYTFTVVPWINGSRINGTNTQSEIRVGNCDWDGDGINHSGGSCLGLVDCDDSDADVVPPYDDLIITRDTTLCPGTYYLNDSGSYWGVVIINASSVDLDCNNATLIGNISNIGITTSIVTLGAAAPPMEAFTDISIHDCNLNNYISNIVPFNITNSRIYNNTLTANQTNISRGIGLFGISSVKNSVVDNNRISDIGYPIDLQNKENSRVNITNNIIQLNCARGIQINGLYHFIYNNTISDCLIRGGSGGIALFHTNYSTVQKNTLFNNNVGIGITSDGNGLTGSGTGNAYYNVIIENEITSSNRSGIYLGYQGSLLGDSDSVRIRFNNITLNSFNNTFAFVSDIEIVEKSAAALLKVNNTIWLNNFYAEGVTTPTDYNNTFCVPDTPNGLGNYYSANIPDANVFDEPCGNVSTPVTDKDRDGFYNYFNVYIGPADCNDNNPAIKPGAQEVCDGVDNNCNGQTDEDCPVDEERRVSNPSLIRNATIYNITKKYSYVDVNVQEDAILIIRGERHRLLVNLIHNQDSPYGEFTLFSFPIRFRLDLGESKDFDTNDNGVDDLRITFDEVYLNRAILKIKLLTDQELDKPKEAPIVEEKPAPVEEPEEVPKEKPAEIVRKKFNYFFLFAVAVIIIIALILWGERYIKKRIGKIKPPKTRLQEIAKEVRKEKKTKKRKQKK